MGTIELTIDGCKVRIRTRRARTDGRSWWVADLRSAGFREQSLGIEALPGTEGRAAAAAGILLTRLRADGGPHPEARPAPGTIDAARASWLAAVHFASETTRGFYAKHIKLSCRDLGAITVAELAPPNGNAILSRWRDGMRARGLGAHTASHRIGALRRMLVWCVEEGWLRALPRMPDATVFDGEVIYVPTCEPITAEHYELARAAMFPILRARAAKGQARAIDHLARRLLYLDFVRYTGAHQHDADTLAGEHVHFERGVFFRRNLKNKKTVRPMWITMPPALALAMRVEWARRGGIKRGELVMGKWLHPTERIAEACAKAGVRPFSLLDLRSTVATELALAGVKIEATVALLGHASSQMARLVYERIPAEALSADMAKIGALPAPALVPAPAPIIDIASQIRIGDAEARKGPHAAPSSPASQARRKNRNNSGGNHGK